MSQSDTIFALSSGGGRAGVSVLRISGARSVEALLSLSNLSSAPSPRLMQRLLLADFEGEPLDDGLAVFFPGPRSFTGEDVVELFVHGSTAVVKGALTALGQVDGLRPAEAGEFTQRAFLNGKLDLAEVEGLGDLIDSQTETQRRLSLRQLGGALSDQVMSWRDAVILLRAEVEAWIDFPDEDLPDDFLSTVSARSAGLGDEISSAVGSSHRLASSIRDGFSVALVGLPNVGKSSLLNALAARDIAIVTDIAGTTRDALAVPLNVDGLLVSFVDTAGVRETDDAIEALGVERALKAAHEADLILHLFDDRGPDETLLQSLSSERSLAVRTKADQSNSPSAGVEVSALTGEGVPGLLAEVKSRLVGDDFSLEVLLPMGRQRHETHLRRACQALARVGDVEELALMAELLRDASTSLGRITGAVDVEDVLDHIFSRFCIGK